MAKKPEKSAARYIEPRARLAALRAAAADCRACDLYKNATQTVFGEGPQKASLLFVGEVPGDREDRAGKPFVGPAGLLLDRALAEAGIERRRVYVTNAVKHFKFIMRGKKRLHQKPNVIEIEACKPWLLAEIDSVKPAVVVCLGATAAQALLGRGFRVTRDRGKRIASELAGTVVATVHPSALLRMPDEDSRHREYARFVADLRLAYSLVAKPWQAHERRQSD